MTQDEIGRIAEAVADRLMNGPLRKRLDAMDKRFGGIENHLDRQDSTLKKVNDGLAYVSSRMDEHFGSA